MDDKSNSQDEDSALDFDSGVEEDNAMGWETAADRLETALVSMEEVSSPSAPGNGSIESRVSKTLSRLTSCLQNGGASPSAVSSDERQQHRKVPRASAWVCVLRSPVRHLLARCLANMRL